jgi:hypothetical protein
VRSFGVKCKGCGEHIHLAEVTQEYDREINFYVVPLEPIPCPLCGHTDNYGSEDKEYKTPGARISEP